MEKVQNLYMELTQEIANKFESESTLLEKVKVMLEDARQPEIIYSKMEGEVERSNGRQYYLYRLEDYDTLKP